MSTSEAQTDDASGAAGINKIDMKFEVAVIPVSDVDRAKEFYGKLGWRLDADRAIGDDFRLVQFTPPGSACSIQFGTNLTTAAPGSAQALLLIVSDVKMARDELVKRGVGVSAVYHCAQGTACRFRDADGLFERVSGAAPDHASYSSFASFRDPDSNAWVLQEVTTRLPGRIDPGTMTYATACELESALARAALAHGRYEKRMGKPDPEWPKWYSEYMVAEQSGAELPM
jgi:catechol 2,3-dioxygenase-like lactoylglutathione lyase family enzyme